MSYLQKNLLTYLLVPFRIGLSILKRHFQFFRFVLIKTPNLDERYSFLHDSYPSSVVTGPLSTVETSVLEFFRNL